MGSEALCSSFHYAADRKPVAIFLAFFLLDLIVFALDLPLSLTLFYAVLVFFPKAMITAWNHHHQHVPTFKHSGLNMALEVIYGFQTGVLPSGWVLHHNLGHHPNYMKGAEDESAWITTKGRKLGELEYTLRVGLLAYVFILRNIARFDAKHGKRFLKGCLLTGLLFYGLWSLNPRNAVLLFLIPPVCALFGTVWFTYKHHAGLNTQVAEEASWNVLDPFYNKLTGNLGYHTAHHISCGTHWSKLPDLHARISKKIPKNLYREPGFPFPLLEALLLFKNPRGAKELCKRLSLKID
ncbi:MAG: fatty acid desaturase [Pseudomonadota bacterium]